MPSPSPPPAGSSPTSDGSAPRGTVVVTGSAGLVGRATCGLLRRVGYTVVGLDRIAVGAMPPGSTPPTTPEGGVDAVVDVGSDDLSPWLRGATAVVHLADPGTGESAAPEVAARVAEAAALAGVRQLLVMSTAAVYGAWPDNPVPLTEAAPPHPNPGIRWVADKVLIESQARAWGDRTGAAVCVLRPAMVLGGKGQRNWLAEMTLPGWGQRLGRTLPPRQFLHVEDLAAAIEVAVTKRLSGTFNVAPADWLSGDDVATFLGTSARIPLVARAASVLDRLARLTRPVRRFPRAIRPLAREPWVMAADRLRSQGWAPRSTSAEVLVAHQPPPPLARFFARRRQEVALGGVVVAAAAGGSALAVAAARAARSLARRRTGR